MPNHKALAAALWLSVFTQTLTPTAYILIRALRSGGFHDLNASIGVRELQPAAPRADRASQRIAADAAACGHRQV